MATIGNTMPTLLDVSRRLDPNGRIDLIAEYMTRVNQVLDDSVWLEGNLPTGNMSTMRTGIPQGAWRRLNYGVPQGKSQTRQVTDTAGMLEVYSKIDKKLAMLNGNSTEWRASEDSAIIEGLSQQMAQTLFYGDTDANPERFLGLTPRFTDPSTDITQSGINIIGGDASDPAHTDCASIWLVTWSPQYAYFFYPKGSQAGITMEDLGQDTAVDADGGEFEILRTHYGVDVGLTVRNWQGIVRICNIRRSQLNTAASTSNVYDLMTRALERVPETSGRQAFYCDRQIRSFMRRQIRDKANVNLTMDEVAGKRVLAFDGIPVRQVDALMVNEAYVDNTNMVNW